jgi:hypothetical protein
VFRVLVSPFAAIAEAGITDSTITAHSSNIRNRWKDLRVCISMFFPQLSCVCIYDPIASILCENQKKYDYHTEINIESYPSISMHEERCNKA